LSAWKRPSFKQAGYLDAAVVYSKNYPAWRKSKNIAQITPLPGKHQQRKTDYLVFFFPGD